jgi:hypothetical protein
MSDSISDAGAEPDSVLDPDILACLSDPVVVPSPIRTVEERLANPSAMTISFREIQEQLKRQIELAAADQNDDGNLED